MLCIWALRGFSLCKLFSVRFCTCWRLFQLVCLVSDRPEVGVRVPGRREHAGTTRAAAARGCERWRGGAPGAPRRAGSRGDWRQAPAEPPGVPRYFGVACGQVISSCLGSFQLLSPSLSPSLRSRVGLHSVVSELGVTLFNRLISPRASVIPTVLTGREYEPRFSLWKTECCS